MELDDFKSVLRTKLEEPLQLRSPRELERSIHSKTNSIIGKIKRSIVFELLINLLFLPIAWAGIHYSLLYVRCIFIVVAIGCFLFMTYTALFYRRILFFEKNIPAVKERLQQVIDLLQRFTRLYFRFTMWVLPLVFLLGLVTGYRDIITRPELAHGFRWVRGFLFYALFFAGWSVMMYFFAKWYIKRLYGNYLEQLKASLKDLENG
ncbi:MAG TPA: hypothetical protein VGM41_15695 [Chitinophagaceae bacterium]|jgi:hypothetical protein